MIGYFGLDTYSEMAALQYLQLNHAHLHDTLTLIRPYPSISQVINAAENGNVDIAVVPVENSIQGSVSITLDSLWQSKSLQIQQVIILPVSPALITRAEILKNIKVIYSNHQGLAECQQWLKRYIPNVQQIETNSITNILQIVDEDSTVAAIGSKCAAEISKLPILEYAINDQPNNYTRFLVLGRNALTIKGTHSSIAFSLKHNIPGTLVKSLLVFNNHQINMSRIESRPTKRSLGEYIFFVDIEATSDNSSFSEALQELKSFTESVRVLGSYSISITN